MKAANGTKLSWRNRAQKKLIALLPKSIISWAVFLVVGVAALIAGSRWVWGLVRYHVELQEEYLVDPDTIELVPSQPLWIKNDLKAMVVREAGLSPPLSLLDEQLSDRIAQAFVLNPWVAQVKNVAKSYPRHVRVDVAYRRPVAMVEVRGGLLPIDETSVLLPTADFSPEDAEGYLRISGVASSPIGPLGTAWGDPNVEAAARLAAQLEPARQELHLRGIRIEQPSPNAPAPPAPILQVATPKGTAFIWGDIKVDETESPQLMVGKLARLSRLAKKHSSLDAVPQHDRDLRQSAE